MSSPEIKALAQSVTTFVDRDQTEEVLCRVQNEVCELKTTVETLAEQMKAEQEAQTKASDTTSCTSWPLSQL